MKKSNANIRIDFNISIDLYSNSSFEENEIVHYQNYKSIVLYETLFLGGGSSD